MPYSEQDWAFHAEVHKIKLHPIADYTKVAL
jgi:hypothetical protein